MNKRRNPQTERCTLEMKVSFNLLDEPWIPVRSANANDPPVILLSLTEVFKRSNEIRRIEHVRPLVVAALYRLLVAICVRALPPERDAERHRHRLLELSNTGLPVDSILAYLEASRGRFDLFNPDDPFMQVAGIEEQAWCDAWYRLTAEDGSGNTSAISNPQNRLNADDVIQPISASEAACLLVAHQQYALGGLIKRIITSSQSAKNAPAATFVLEGPTLTQTLLLNTPHMRATEFRADVAWWERARLTRAMIEAQQQVVYDGFVSAWTWPSRALLLVPQVEEGEIVVRNVYYAPGVPMADTDVQLSKDPLCAYRTTKDGVQLPLRISVDRAMWRNCQTFLPTGLAGTTPPYVIEQALSLNEDMNGEPHALSAWTIRVLGQANDKSKVDLVLDESFTISADVLHAHMGRVEEAVTAIDTVGSALRASMYVFANEVLSTAEKSADPDAAKKLAESTRTVERYWWLMNGVFTRFLAGQGTEDEYVRLVEDVLHTASTLLSRSVEGQGMNKRIIRGVAPAYRTFYNAVSALRSITKAQEVTK